MVRYKYISKFLNRYKFLQIHEVGKKSKAGRYTEVAYRFFAVELLNINNIVKQNFD